MQAFSSRTIYSRMVTGPMIMSRWQSVRATSFIDCETSTDMHFLFLDLRNKFGSLHNQYTSNRERELFSTYGHKHSETG
jgi:hypothetical protein